MSHKGALRLPGPVHGKGILVIVGRVDVIVTSLATRHSVAIVSFLFEVGRCH